VTEAREEFRFDIAIVGGGFSGVMLAAHLLGRPSGRIALIEPRPAIGRGRAYATEEPVHLLNVPAAKMSALPEDPGHFLRWLEGQGRAPEGPATFAPRGLYGRYLADTLEQAAARALPGSRLERLVDEAVAIDPAPEGARLTLASGRQLSARQVVLAIGNFPPGLPGAGFAAGPRYVPDPWAPGALEGIRPDEDVLLVGTGLTALDVALQLVRAGHRGVIHAISRRGLLPAAHRAERLFEAYAFRRPLPARLSGLVRAVRAELAEAAAAGADWRVVLDALRPRLQGLWQGLDPAERRRFLRHLRPYWEAHRHRAPEATAGAIAKLASEGRFVRHAGRILGYESAADGVRVRFAPRGARSPAPQTLEVGHVLNCTGPQTDFGVNRHPLIAHLRAQGAIRPDALGLGIEVTPAGAVLDARGQASGVLFTLGSPMKGALWETTAVPELRQQAAALAATLVPDRAR
jgi:uncharacterized NAD(P)/FAD-binding protein YdhS